MKPCDEIQIPAELGLVRETWGGDSDTVVFVIETVPGKPDGPAQEYRLLRHIHAHRALSVIFQLLDCHTQQISNGLTDTARGDFVAFREFPNRDVASTVKIIEEVASSYLAAGLLASAAAMGILAEPAVAVNTCDDWYHWARSRLAIRRLSTGIGRCELAIALIRGFAPTGMRDSLDALLSLLRLESRGDFRTNPSPDLPALMGKCKGLPASMASEAVVVLSQQWENALEYCTSYEQRVQTAAAKVARRIRRNGYRRAAFLIDQAFANKALERLRQGGYPYITIALPGRSKEPLLDYALTILGDKQEETSLDAFFLGRPVRSRIQVLREREKDEHGKQVEDLVVAADRLLSDYRETHDAALVGQASELVDRAVTMDHTSALAWRTRACIRYEMEGRTAEAQADFNCAVVLDPLNASHFLAMGRTVNSTGFYHSGGIIVGSDCYTKAARLFLKGLFRRPWDGELWYWLAIAFWNKSSRQSASACFTMARYLGIREAAGYMQNLFGGKSFMLVPLFFLMMPVLLVASRVMLPLRYRFRRTFLLVSILAAPFLATWAADRLVHVSSAPGVFSGLAQELVAIALGFFGTLMVVTCLVMAILSARITSMLERKASSSHRTGTKNRPQPHDASSNSEAGPERREDPAKDVVTPVGKLGPDPFASRLGFELDRHFPFLIVLTIVYAIWLFVAWIFGWELSDVSLVITQIAGDLSTALGVAFGCALALLLCCLAARALTRETQPTDQHWEASTVTYSSQQSKPS